jgi:hypothetical protein
VGPSWCLGSLRVALDRSLRPARGRTTCSSDCTSSEQRSTTRSQGSLAAAVSLSRAQALESMPRGWLHEATSKSASGTTLEPVLELADPRLTHPARYHDMPYALDSAYDPRPGVFELRTQVTHLETRLSQEGKSRVKNGISLAEIASRDRHARPQRPLEEWFSAEYGIKRCCETIVETIHSVRLRVSTARRSRGCADAG